MRGNKEVRGYGVGIPTIGFEKELEEYLDSLSKEQLAVELKDFGFTEEAKSSGEGGIEEVEVQSLLFMCYDHMRLM